MWRLITRLVTRAGGREPVQWRSCSPQCCWGEQQAGLKERWGPLEGTWSTRLPSKFRNPLKVLSKEMTGSDMPSRKIPLNASEGCTCIKNHPSREKTKTRDRGNGVEGRTPEIWRRRTQPGFLRARLRELREAGVHSGFRVLTQVMHVESEVSTEMTNTKEDLV